MKRRQRLGTVFLVGAGPGSPDLITVRGADLICRADCIVYDRLVHPALLERARRGARLIFVGKEGGGPSTPQAEINDIIVQQARLGRDVVRLKGGDPFVFGRGGEEAIALAEAGIPLEIVPGVSSGVGVPGLVGIPVTHRGAATNVTFATAHTAATQPDWDHLAKAQTLVLFMGGKLLEQSTAALIKAGRAASTPVAIIEAGSLEHERVIEGTLADIARKASEAEVGSPALLVVGEVTRVRQQIAKSLQRRSVRARAAVTGGVTVQRPAAAAAKRKAAR